MTHDQGEPISRGQVDRRAADRRALADVLWFAGLFTGGILVSGVLAMLGIVGLQELGVWPLPEATPRAPQPSSQMSELMIATTGLTKQY